MLNNYVTLHIDPENSSFNSNLGDEGDFAQARKLYSIKLDFSKTNDDDPHIYIQVRKNGDEDDFMDVKYDFRKADAEVLAAYFNAIKDLYK